MDVAAAGRYVAPYLYTLEENVFVKGGFTYTVNAVLFDSNTGATVVYWSVENPEGLGDYKVAPNGEIYLLETSAMRWVVGGGNYLDSANSTETKLSICSYDVSWQDEITAQFGACLDSESGKHAGSFDIQEVVIPRSDMGGMVSLELDGGITLSPIAVSIEGDALGLGEFSIVCADGSEYTVFSEESFVDNTTYGLMDERGGATYVFNRIVDVESVSGVMVNGEMRLVSRV